MKPTALALLQYVVAPLIAGVIGALLSTYLNAHFNFRRFRKEQWWQAKREAYESIIRKLSETLYSIRRRIADIETAGANVPIEGPVRQKELSWSLQEIGATGAYIVSDKTATAVLKAVDALGAWIGNDEHAKLEHDYDAVKEALDIARAEAHRDLQVEDAVS